MSKGATKYHALGNSYLFFDSNEHEILEIPFIKRICNPNFGIGSDGVLYGGYNGNEFELTIINPDGSIAEISGNGVRIFARAMLDYGYVKVDDEFDVTTFSRSVHCKFLSKKKISVDMGMPMFDGHNLPSDGFRGYDVTIGERRYTYYPVSMGNPHCVVFVDSLSRENALSDGPILENNVNFREKTNVQFAHVIDRSNIEIEIWERGAGYTLSSGSSSCGVFAVAKRLNKCGPKVSIAMVGGTLLLEEKESGTIIQTGSVERIAKCTIDN